MANSAPFTGVSPDSGLGVYFGSSAACVAFIKVCFSFYCVVFSLSFITSFQTRIISYLFSVVFLTSYLTVISLRVNKKIHVAFFSF